MYRPVAYYTDEYQWVLYLKKNHPYSAITTSKDFVIGPPRHEKSGVSKLSRTFGHPVDNKNPRENALFCSI